MVQYRSRVRPLIRHKSIVTRETVRSLKNGYVGRLMFNITVVVLGKIFGIRACHGSINTSSVLQKGCSWIEVIQRLRYFTFEIRKC